ncbi:alpha/beta hydrolase [Actinokineospora diospyrosa]|uniref:Lysophospholipase, alpha-beta hydrolase superfamily n=1 Tax=Actinokineospora diospyrosa TaxID=103728 RepID=A0ABT1IBL3_9PSEU|nr:alpha/beta hydrolase [Actinokineospora diospyrosa]MCP2270017.1 Lysophospholipase, alpha-beta hydrolase superfamily [Actinokineospora diospyrosa]
MSRHTDFPGPEGARTRGTVVVVPGRGETRASYARLGARLAAEAYRVRVIDGPQVGTDDVESSVDRFAAELSDALPELVRPLVLLGADTGAAVVEALLERQDTTAPWWPEAAVLAGLPGPGTAATGTWDEELDVRTTCPVHREVLTADSGVERGALAVALPDALTDLTAGAAVEVPRLVLVGDEDPLADRAGLTSAVKAWPRARLSVVRGAHHDVLNDRQHRSVAAEVVSFLEVLGNELVPVISVESSTW